MSNTNTEVLTTAYEKLQGAITQANTVLPELEEAVEKGNLDNYATTSQLEQKANKVEVNNKIWSMANMGQDVKEAMTGGSVAVVGIDAVGTINLQNNSVTPQKISNIPYDLITKPSNLPISGFEPWSKGDGDQLIISNNTVSFHQSSTGDRGMLTPKIVNANLSKPLKLSFLYRTNSSSCDVYCTSSTGEYKDSIQSLPKSEDFKKHVITLDTERLTSLGIASEFRLLFATHESGAFIYIKEIELGDNHLKHTGETLVEVLNSIYEDTHKELNYEDIKKKYTYWGTLKNLEPWSGGNFTIEDNVLSFSHTNDTGNSGMITPTFTSKTNFVTAKGNITNITKNTSNAGMQLYVVGNNISDGSTMYIFIKKIEEVGKFCETIDLNNLVVYKSLDLTKPIQILFSSLGNISITVEDYAVYEDYMQGADLVGDTLKDTCITFNNQINTVKTKLTEIEGSLDTGNNILISPNGTKYLTQVTDEGNLISIPVIPNKTLFIGNSLLLGHGDFGMCATNSKEDYYYHVTQYIKSIKPSATFQRVSGAPFEMSESQQAVDDWINSNIKNKDNDFDLVIIQLGDNVNNNARNELFKTSCEYLIKAVRNHLPKARICWVGEWYYTQQRQDIISKACINTGSTFIDITGLRQFKEYEGNIGDIITRDDGSTFEVVSTGVASHPGNSGMKAIADMIIEELF